MDTRIANAVLVSLDEDFGALYARRFGRPSIPPERLQRAMLLQVFYGIPSERQVTERIEFDLLFRWVVGLGVDGAVWDHSSFSTNRERRLGGEIAAKFLRAILAQPRVKRLVSSDHFSVNGGITQASGAAEREAALAMLDRRTRRRRLTHSDDRANYFLQLVEDLPGRSVTPHIAIDGLLSKTGKPRATAMDRRTTRHPGYAISQCCRKRIEEVFGWTVRLASPRSSYEGRRMRRPSNRQVYLNSLKNSVSSATNKPAASCAGKCPPWG